MEITIKTLPARRVAAVLHRGPYQQIGPAFQKLGKIAASAGMTGGLLGIYWDDPRTTPAEDLRSAAAMSISEADTVPASLVEERIESGRFTCFLHVGPYEALPVAWAEALGTFLSSGHRRRAGLSLEIYVNNPTEVSPALLQTEIAIPME